MPAMHGGRRFRPEPAGRDPDLQGGYSPTASMSCCLLWMPSFWYRLRV